MKYYYRLYESKATTPFSLHEPRELHEKEKKTNETQDQNGSDLLDFFTGQLGNRVDKEYIDPETDKLVFLDGLFNEKEGFIKIDKAHIGFSFLLNTEKREISFTDSFHYTDLQTGKPQASRVRCLTSLMTVRVVAFAIS